MIFFTKTFIFFLSSMSSIVTITFGITFAFSGLLLKDLRLNGSAFDLFSAFEVLSFLGSCFIGDMEVLVCFSTDFLERGIQLGLAAVSELLLLSVDF